MINDEKCSAVAAKSSQVETFLGYLEKETSRSLDVIEMLSDSISTITRGLEPPIANNEKPEEQLVPLADRIRGSMCRQRDANNLLESITANIEL